MAAGDYRERIYAHYLDAARPAAAARRPEQLPRGRVDFLRHVVGRHFPPSREAAIIDLGCGDGALVHFARAAGYMGCTGVDAAPAQIAEARRLGVEGVGEGDAMETLRALGDGSQDAIVAFDVIEHFTKDEVLAFADQVRRVLKPGGRWIIHTVNGESPFAGRVRHGDFTHELAFTRASLAQVLAACGFSQTQCFEDAPIPRRPAAALRWVLWQAARLAMMVALVAESGADGTNAILSQNLLCVATK